MSYYMYYLIILLLNRTIQPGSSSIFVHILPCFLPIPYFFVLVILRSPLWVCVIKSSKFNDVMLCVTISLPCRCLCLCAVAFSLSFAFASALSVTFSFALSIKVLALTGSAVYSLGMSIGSFCLVRFGNFQFANFVFCWQFLIWFMNHIIFCSFASPAIEKFNRKKGRIPYPNFHQSDLYVYHWQSLSTIVASWGDPLIHCW